MRGKTLSIATLLAVLAAQGVSAQTQDKIQISDEDVHKIELVYNSDKSFEKFIDDNLKNGKIRITSDGRVIVDLSVYEILMNIGKISALKPDAKVATVCARTSK